MRRLARVSVPPTIGHREVGTYSTPGPPDRPARAQRACNDSREFIEAKCVPMLFALILVGLSLVEHREPGNDTSGRLLAVSTSPAQRLALAVVSVAELLKTSSYTELHCPQDQWIGKRLKTDTPNAIGNLCEPWTVRGAAMVLDHYLDPSMHGLEWSAGSSSMWALRRLKSLTSVEHDQLWAATLQKHLERTMPQLKSKWTLAPVPCIDAATGTPGGGACAATKGQGEGEGANYSTYIATPRVKFSDRFPFDYVLVDGRRRSECLAEVMLHTSPGMLNEAYGLLALDNSERPYVANVPSHWPCASFRAAGQTHETVLWMRCPTRHDADCATARRQINQTMATLPSHLVGGRCSSPRE